MAVRARPRPPRGNDSWRLAVTRAQQSWDELTGGPRSAVFPVEGVPGRPVYSDQAAASILATALGLWADTSAELAV